MERKLLILLLILSAKCHSQEMLRVSIRVSSSNNNEIIGKIIYLCDSDSVVDSRMLRDGVAFFDIEQSNVEKYVLALRGQNEALLRVKMKSLLDYERPVEATNLKIVVMETKPVYYSHGNEEEIRKSNTYYRFFDPNSFSQESQMQQYGYLRWYFPSELLINIDTSYERLLSQWYNEDRYYRKYGFYPNEGVIDSIKTSLVKQRAEGFAGWYSDRLIQLNEPILCNGYKKKEVYRFTWSSNSHYFIYDPYCMRVEPDENGNAILYFSYLKWDTCEEYQLYCDIIPMDNPTFKSFLNIYNKVNVPNKKSVLDNGESNNILESYIDGQYHVIFRGAGEDEVLDELHKFLWNLTGLGKNKIVHYRQRIE